MKKIIPSILLAVLASSSLLLAQSECDQVTGNRLQALSREQSTEYRLQVRNTNQVTGYRLQVAGTNQSTENQIRQQAEPTANCNNLGQDLSCHLMMNPAIEGEEKAIEKLILGETRTPRSSESIQLGNSVREEITTVSSLPTTTPSGFPISNEHQTTMLDEITSIEDQGENGIDGDIKQLKILQKDFETSKAARKVAQDMLLLSQAQVEQASKNKIDMEKQLVKENEELNILKKKCRALFGVAREMEFDDEGNLIDESKQEYNKQRIVVRMQTALPNVKNIFEEAKQRLETHKLVAIAAEKEELMRAKIYFEKGKIVLSKIDRAMVNAIADKEKGDTLLPANISSPSLRDAVETDEVRRTKAFGARLYISYCPSRNPSPTQHSSSLPQVAVDGDETIQFLRRALEEEFIIGQSNGKISEIAPTVFEGKTIDGKQETSSFNKVVNSVLPSVEQVKKVSEAECQKNEREGDYFDEENIINSLTSESIDQLNQAAISLAKAVEVEHNNNKPLDNLWRNIAEQRKIAAEFYKKAATSYMQENETEAERYMEDGESIGSHIHWLEKAAKSLEEVILHAKEASETKISSSQPISDLWRKIAEQYQFIFEHYRKVAEAQMKGNKEEITRFNKADWSIRFSAEQLEAAVACTEEAIQAERSRNKDISDLWIKTAEQYQVAAEYERKNAETRMLDNEQEKKRWQEVSAFARYSADRLKTAVEALEASFIETYQGDEAIANLWEKIVVENQMTAEYWKKAEEAQVAGNEGNINRFKYAADSARYGADQLSEAVEPLQNAIKAAKQGNQPLSEIWHKSAEQHEISAMHYLKAAASEALGTYIPSNQYSRLDKAAYDASCSAKQFQTVAEGYPSKNEQEYIQAKEAAKIYASGDKEKCERLEKTAGITYFLSEESRCLAEIAESKESGNTEKISLLHKSAQYNKVAADSMKSSLDRLEKASEASRIDNHSLSTLWGKTAEQYQQAAEYYHKSAEGYETDCKEDSRRVGKKEGWKEGQRFGGDWKGLDSGFEFNSGCGRRSLQGAFQLEKSIECTEKAISAEEKENQSLSDLWHKAAEQYQIAADYSSKHAQARASSWHFTGDEKANQLMCQADAAWKIAQQLEYAAIALEKAIKADNHNQPLADLWRKTAEQHQVAVEYGYKHAENLVFKFANPHASKKENPRFYETRDAAISSAERFKEAAIAFKNTEVESEREMASKIAHLSSEEKEHLMKAKNAFSMIKYASDNFFSNHARAKEASEVFHEAAYRAVIVTRVLAGRNYRDLLDYRPTGIDDNIDKSYLNSNDDFIRAASHAAKLASNIYYIFSSYASSHNRIAILQIDAATSFAVDACSAGVGTDYEKEINEMADIIRRLKVYVYTEGEKNNEEQLKRVDKETQEESAIATKKEDSIAEKAEEGAVATITDTPSPKIKKRQFKIQPFHQTVEQIIQLETKRIALKERAALLLSETTEAHSRGELFLTKGQQALTVQLNQALEEVEKALHEGTVATFQACMSRLQQFEEKDHYFQQIALQLQQLDQSKIALVKQGINLKNSIKILQDQNETFLVQDQERLLMEAGKLYLKIHQIEGQLVTKAEKASEQAEELLLQCAEFQQQVEALQDKVKIIATEKALNEKQEIERKAKAEDVRVAEEKVLEQERVTKEESNPSEPEALRLQVEKKE